MQKNAGDIDRIIRIVIGLVLLSLVVIGPHSYLGFIGVIPLVTGAIGFCPLYTLLGLNTCKLAKAK